MTQPHHEKEFENYIVRKLEGQGWVVGDTSGYDMQRAVYLQDVFHWVQVAFPEKWQKLHAINGGRSEETLLDRLAAAIETHGTVKVLRHGFDIAGAGHVDMSETAPEDLRNEAVLTRYQANRLRVVPQVRYNPTHAWAIDLVFFINGLPVATVEIKTDFTQAVEDAMDQYRHDRLPVEPQTRRNEPLLTFKRGAVVHFAMSDSDIRMTTKLDGENTRFLPFNLGNNGRAGNPTRDDEEYPVAYFWEQVLQRDAWLRIFHSFVYVETKEVAGLDGSYTRKETLIFPRFHQWSAVNAMVEDAKAKGPGQAYLCEHSAGSGKTSTIAWTAHDLVRLRQDDGAAIFNSVIIVTDRTVLDSQLQEAVRQIDHQFGVIAAISRDTSSKSKSQQLAEALTAGVPIIVVTLQTFPYAMEAILTETSLKDRNFAVIIDEAHASQTGATASKLQAVLALDAKEEMAQMTVEQLLEHIQRSRVRPANISHFAFTATPKHSTMMLFGRRPDSSHPASEDNLPQSFHRYPMRQAIEEKFILDVLQNYTPYQTAFNLNEQLETGSGRVDTKHARRALAQWMALHPTNVTQKVQFIVEHFSHNVAGLLNGRAKAMVVTSSRAAAVRYKKAFDAYIAKHPQYAGIKTLVAFSGKLTGKQVKHFEDERISGDEFIADDEEEFTESSMNPAIRVYGSDLRKIFDRPEYRVMLVADKFQTGFDQPKLVAMYIDKKIANEVEIVQTLSRLNRTAPGKDQTFVIDFVNDPKAVREAFAKYDAGAHIEEPQDLNVVYDIKARLDGARIYDHVDLSAFRKARFEVVRDAGHGGQDQHRQLYAATQRPTDVYNEKLKAVREAVRKWESAYEQAHLRGDEDGMKAADVQRKVYADELEVLVSFKRSLGQFSRTYSYIAQLVDFGDPELENFAGFVRLLAKRLNGVPRENVDVTGLMLTGYGIKERGMATPEPDPEGEADISLRPLRPGADPGESRAPEYLAEIIRKLNALFGQLTPIEDQASFINHVASITRENAVVMAQVDNNDFDQALKGNLPGAVEQAVVRALSSHEALAGMLLKADEASLQTFTRLIYDVLKHRQPIDVSG